MQTGILTVLLVHLVNEQVPCLTVIMIMQGDNSPSKKAEMTLTIRLLPMSSINCSRCSLSLHICTYLLPQILNVVLKDFSLFIESSWIRKVCLGIF